MRNLNGTARRAERGITSVQSEAIQLKTCNVEGMKIARVKSCAARSKRPLTFSAGWKWCG